MKPPERTTEVHQDTRTPTRARRITHTRFDASSTNHLSTPPSPWPRQKLRFAVVGLGKQSVEYHVPGLLAADTGQLAAVCDADQERTSREAERLGVPGYTSYEELFKQESIDVVIVAVPHHLGGPIIEAAANHGVHILKEKPFAATLAEAQSLAKHCDAAGVKLMVTLQRRFNPIYTSFPQLADQVGTPFIIDAKYTLFIQDPSEGWRGQTATAGGGCIVDMGYHLIDMILWYFGLPDRVMATLSASARPDRVYDAEDTALIYFSYESGLYGSLMLSRFIGPKTEQIRLVGNKGIVHLERGHIQRLNNRGEVVESLAREQAWPSAATCQIDHFCRVIHGLRPNDSGPQEHLAHMAFIHACYESAKSGAYVDPKEVLACRA